MLLSSYYAHSIAELDSPVNRRVFSRKKGVLLLHNTPRHSALSSHFFFVDHSLSKGRFCTCVTAHNEDRVAVVFVTP